MTHPIWPLFDLRVVTPRLELRAIDDEIGAELAALAALGIHDPGFMPFAFEWTDVAPPQLQVNSMQHYWRHRAEWTPTSWNCTLGVIVDGVAVGSTAMMSKNFAVLRQFETGSWLGRAYQGLGIGTEMREATLQLGFVGLDAKLATTAAYADNGPSLGVTQKLGYAPNGVTRRLRRGEEATIHNFTMNRDHWQTNLRRDDIHIHGLEPCLALFGARQG